ncbi:TniQ family protein [Clostridium sp. Sa3CUN1]|uniref:TniQ family protein n=1 Tax=Clostridium gallinarum TaxID=2762246 RepID=A0ABR8Q0J7_9CLOT|nr:TnsD family Tn7-like transposition protein [Clostridium gallinarum]MBD7913937.1 TniQ family protein [Clostridium gallinarum]
MIDFFTDPYKDELIYSAIARFHFYSGNIDFKDTIEECFGKRTMIPTLEFGGRLEYLANELGGTYTADDIINKNTIFPYYAPFIDYKRRDEILRDIKFNGSGTIYTKLGIIAGSICKKNYIYYCPICAMKDIQQYGEAYIHREHQLQGIMICAHDGNVLKRYSIRKLDSSRIKYIKLDKELLSLEIGSEKVNNYEKHLKLAKDAHYLFTEDLNEINKNNISSRYKFFLFSKGLARRNGTIKQRRLYEEFIDYYGVGFLESLESYIDFDDEYNWLKIVTRNSERVTHPIRHLLLIGFLCNNIEEFFKTKIIWIDKKVENSKYNIENANLNKLSEYKRNFIKIIDENKGMNRTTLREQLKKEYIYLYRYDREWLFSNLPKKIKEEKQIIRIDWEKRDKLYFEILQKKYIEIKSLEKPVRITRTSLAKSLGILDNIEKKIEKLPLTRNFLEKVFESTKDFQLRRCKVIIDNLIQNNEEIKLWKIQRTAAIRTNQFNDIKDCLIQYIEIKSDCIEKII